MGLRVFSVKTLSEALRVCMRDKKIILLSLAPLFLGIILYGALGFWIYDTVFQWIKHILGAWVSQENFGNMIGIILHFILILTAYFISSWAFILIVSIISSPFHDMISLRVERVVRGEEPESLKESFGKSIKRLFSIVMNEIKKIILFLFFGVTVFFLSFIPPLIPLYLLISSLLFCAGYLDYSWSRHNYPLLSCLKFLGTHILHCTFAGGLFLAIISLPFINIFIPPLAVIYFSVFFSKTLNAFASLRGQ